MKETKSSRDLIAENSQDSSSQIQRYLRLNELISGLLNLVDEGRIALTPASEISFLTEQEQEWLLLTIESEQTTPSLSQATDHPILWAADFSYYLKLYIFQVVEDK